MQHNDEEALVGACWNNAGTPPAGKVKAWESDGQGGGRVVFVSPEEAKRMRDEELELESALAEATYQRQCCWAREQGAWDCGCGDRD